MGSFVPLNVVEAKQLFEREGAAVPNSLALEKRDVTSHDAPLYLVAHDGVAQLELDTRTWQQAPIGFDQRPASRKVQNPRWSSGT